MSQSSGTFRTDDGGRLRLEPDALETISVPARSVRGLLTAVGIFVALSTVGVQLVLAATQPDVAVFGVGFWVSAAVLVLIVALFWWILRSGRVRMRAASRDGIRVDTMSFIATHIPWEAVSEISLSPSGGGLQLGWRLFGGGTVGYLAGEDAVRILTDAQFRQDLARGDTNYPPRKLAVEYWISVPKAEAVVAKLKELRAA